MIDDGVAFNFHRDLKLAMPEGNNSMNGKLFMSRVSVILSHVVAVAQNQRIRRYLLYCYVVIVAHYFFRIRVSMKNRRIHILTLCREMSVSNFIHITHYLLHFIELHVAVVYNAPYLLFISRVTTDA